MKRTPAVALLLLLPAVAIACGTKTPITPAAQQVPPVTASPEAPKPTQPPIIVIPQPVPQPIPQPDRTFYYPRPVDPGVSQYTAKTDIVVRSGPGTSYGAISSISAGDVVTISCQAPGEHVVGPAGGSSLWDQISAPSFGYVSDEFIATGTTGTTEQVAPSC